ncbi:initiation factor 2 [Auricularia subglabra TFB-10046 SS5]|nr:initiation factor 2 [Auricularia subglabra TFB-10046 SS5]
MPSQKQLLTVAELEKTHIVWRPGQGTSIPVEVQAVRNERQRQMRQQWEALQKQPESQRRVPRMEQNSRQQVPLRMEQKPRQQAPLREPRIEDALDARLFGFADTHPKHQRPEFATRERPKQDLNEDRERDIVRKVKKPKTAKAKTVRARTDVYIPDVITVGNLAKVLNVPIRNLQNAMIQAGMEENTDYDQVLSYEYASLLAQELGRNAVMNEEAAFDIFPQPEPADKSALPPRPPVVTIMGHVDHGKTTLLDSLRSTSVAKGEAGGITQHIGAFSVPVKGSEHTITFLDTPGHAAFSAMRARGASVTDIIVLVVAADDGVMAQTMEVIELIKRDMDGVGVVVALNKCDRPGADPELVRLQLMAEGIEIESLGGDVPAVEVSGLTGQGLDELVETISTVAEVMDLRAERTGPAQGSIIESQVVQGMGPVATVLVHRGELTVGATLICGTTSARVRMMSDSNGNNVEAAYPGDAVTVAGWKEVPKAGDEVLQASDKEVQRALANRIRRAESASILEDAQAINVYRRLAKEKREEIAAAAEDTKKGQKAEEQEPEERKEEGPKVLNIIVKADVHGSEEAVVGALQEIGNHQACTKIIHSAVGDVTESDVELAKTAGGMVVAFNVKCPRAIEVLANTSGVPIFSSGIIYRCTDEVRARVSSLIPPIIEKKVIGEVNVLALFEISQRGKTKPLKVAGCRIANGVVQKTKLARVLRNKEIVFEGPIETLRHHKNDVMEMKKGQDCGISVKGFDDPQVGDVIQVYTLVEKPVIL